MRTLYRIVYKDGTHSAWTGDYNWAKKNADFFKARVEMKIFRSIQNGRFYFNIKRTYVRLFRRCSGRPC